MSSPKIVTVFGALAKTPETGGVYGAGVVLSAATDGVLLAQESLVRAAYLEGGQRALQAGAGGTLRRVPPSGRFAAGTIRQEVRGAGAAYSGSVFPLDGLHTMMQVGGHSATGSFGGGSEKWTYAPVSSVAAYASAGAEFYSRGQKWTVAGLYSDFNFLVSDPGISYFEFPWQAIMPTDPADIALPSITYNSHTLLPPKATGLAVTIGNFTAGKVRSITGRMNRVIAPRGDVSGSGSPGHAGFTPGRYAMMVDIVCEAVGFTGTPFTTATLMDPYNLVKNAQAVGLSFTVGGVQYNRWKFNAPQGYVFDVEEGEDGPSSVWTLHCECANSSPILNDGYTVVFD